MQSLINLYKRSRSNKTSTGSFNPLGLYIDFPSINQMFVKDMETGRIDNALNETIISCTILHEHMHWFQHIGTSSGLFFLFLSYVQKEILLNGLLYEIQYLKSPDFPLIDSMSKKNYDWLGKWESLENLYHFINGGICQKDFVRMLSIKSKGKLNIENALIYFSKSIGTGFEETFNFYTGSKANNLFESWKKVPFYKTFSGGKLPFIDNTFFGTLHLFEGAAYLNEFFCLKNYSLKDRRHHLVLTNQSDYLYLKARKIFYEIIKRNPTDYTEIIFMVIVDAALNSPIPPAVWYPLSEEYRIGGERLNPFIRFIILTQTICDFKLDGAINYCDISTIRKLIIDIYSFYDSRNIGGLGEGPHTIFTLLKNIFANIDIDFKKSPITLDSNGIASLKDDGISKPAFLLKKSIEAIQIREKNPELFICPSSLFLADTQKYKELYLSIAPPLFIKDSELMPNNNNHKDWYLFFYVTLIHEELARWIIYCTLDEIIAKLSQYANSFQNVEKGISYTYFAVSLILKNKSLLTQIENALKKNKGKVNSKSINIEYFTHYFSPENMI